MKRFMFLAAVAAFAMVSCGKEDPTGALALSSADIPWDGAEVAATVTSEFEWSVEVSDATMLQVIPASGVGNTDVKVVLAKNTTNEEIPVSITVTFKNGDKTLVSPFEFVIPAPFLSFGGDTYGVTYMKDGKYWMTENLRYVPSGMTVYEPSAEANAAGAKIWYPGVVTTNDAGKYVAVAGKEEAFIRAQGLLYNAQYILGAEYSKEEGFVDVDQSKAICPEGWHIPTAQEWIDLVGACADAARSNKNAPYYDADLSGASLDALNADGMNLVPFPYVNNASYLCTVLNKDESRTYAGFNSMLYFVSSTGSLSATGTVQGYAAMITNNATKTSVNVAKANLNTGIAVRYVKD